MLAVYVGWLVTAYEYHLVDGANLAVHEGGHLLFSPFGQTLQILGGTITQLAFPAAFAIHFARRGQSFDAAVCVMWCAESLMYTAAELGDAERQQQPLVGGHIHDWNWLLSRAGLVAESETIGAALHGLASVVAIGAWVVGARECFSTRPAPV